MKKISKTVHIFIAEDGKEFLNMTDCIYYESHAMIANQRKCWIEKYFSDFNYNRNKWIDNCTEFKQYGGNHIRENRFDTVICDDIFTRQRDGRTTIINLRTGRCGKAIQSNSKFFESETGWAIAWARYRGDEVPDYI